MKVQDITAVTVCFVSLRTGVIAVYDNDRVCNKHHHQTARKKASTW